MLKFLEENEFKDGYLYNYLKHTNIMDNSPLHTHDFYELFLVINGGAIHNINNENILLQRGSLVFIRPNDTHYYNFYKTNKFEFLNIGVKSSTMNKILSLYDTNKDFIDFLMAEHSPNVYINEEKTKIIIELFEVFNTYTENKNIEMSNCTGSFLINYLMFDGFIANFKNDDKIRILKSNWFIQLLYLMNKKENFIVGLPRMIELSHCSQEHLTRTCRKYLCQSPTEIINEIRLNYVVEKLMKTEENIIQIYEEAGFNNLSHFYQIFKKRFKCSPKNFRQTMQHTQPESNWIRD